MSGADEGQRAEIRGRIFAFYFLLSGFWGARIRLGLGGEFA